MRSLIAMFAVLLRAMPRLVMKVVEMGGKMISMLVSAPSEPMPAPMSPPGGEDEQFAVEDRSIRAVAAKLIQGAELQHEDVGGINAFTLRWLRSQSPRALSIICCADADQLRAHMHGRAFMKGVLAYDRAAVVEAEKAKVAVLENPPRRTLREKLAAEGMVY